MELKEFYKLYIPALELALEKDKDNHGYYVKGPDEYVASDLINSISDFENSLSGKNEFIDAVAYYFDAKSHNSPMFKEEISINLKMISLP